MAIPSFVKFLKSNISFLYNTLQKLNLDVDNIYLDFNYVVGKVLEKHPISGPYPTKEETLQILEETKKVLEECVKLYNPTNSIFIAFEGPQAAAKENHMRQMSNLTQIDQNFDNNHKKTIAKKWQEEGKEMDEELQAFIKKDFNKIDFFQCGSTFLHTISEGIREFVEKKVQGDWKLLKFIISDEKVPGEVEYKIYDFIRSQIAAKNYKQSANHFVISSDTDLIMGAIPLYEANIYISQNPIDVNNIICIKEIYKFIENKMLGDEVTEEFKEQNKIRERLIHDFVLIFIFIGNDFLPALPSLENKLRAMYYLLEEYKKFLKKNRYFPIVDEDFYICLPKLQKFFYDLSQDQLNNLNTERKKMQETLSKEQQQLKEKVEANKTADTSAMTPLEKFNMDLDQLYLEKPKKPFSNEKGYFLQNFSNTNTLGYYQEKLPKQKIDEKFVQDLCLNYIEGVIWTYEYLVRGVISWNWTFRYYYSPFPSDILNSFINFQKPNYPTKGGQHAPLVCLVANASPLGDLSYLSETLQNLIKNSEISKYFPTEFSIDNSGKYYFKQSILTDLPLVNLDEIKKAIKKVEGQLNETEKALNSVSKNPRVILGASDEISKEPIFQEEDYQQLKITGIFQRLSEENGVLTFKLKYSDVTCEKLIKKMEESEKKQLEQEEKEKQQKEQYLKEKEESMSRQQCKYGGHCKNLPLGKCKFFHSEEDIKNSNDKDYKPQQKKLPCTKGENCPFLKKGTCKFYHP